MNDRDSKMLMKNYQLIRENQEQADAQPEVDQQKLVAATETELEKLIPQLQAKVATMSDEQKQQILQQINSLESNKIKQTEYVQKILSESYLEEGIFDRLKSRAAGAYGALTGPKPGDTSGKATDYQSQKINKRYEILQNTIGSALKELQRDLKTTKNADPKIQNQVDQMVQTLGSKHAITPVESKLSDVRHSIGKGVQDVGTSLAIAAPILAGATAVGGALGLTGVGLGIAKGAVAGGVTSVLKDLLQGQKPSAKKAALTAIAGGAAGGLASYFTGGAAPTSGGSQAAAGGQPPVDTSNLSVKGNFMYNDPSAHVQPGVASIGASAPTPSGNEFPILHGSAPNFSGSHLDQAKEIFAKTLDAKGAMGTSGGQSVASPHIMNAVDLLKKHVTSADYGKLAQWAQQQDPQTLQKLQNAGQKAIVSTLRSVIAK
jgi:hypothetical protein